MSHLTPPSAAPAVFPTPPENSPGPGGDWSPRDAAALYGTDRWGQGYVGVSEQGHATIHPDRTPEKAIDLPRLVGELRQRDLSTPILLRFPGILQDRLRRIHGAFARAIDEFEYAGRYQAVYPIKVNQQRHVVEELVAFGCEHGLGLEAGSKPELLAVMALADDPDQLVICNGFKDRRYIEAAVLSRKLGQNVVPVVEKFSELGLIVEQARAHGVRPAIGLRVKLASGGSGRWQGSGGERSKFGLFVSEVLEAVELLRGCGMLDCLKLVHFHLGSQISDMRALKAALVEAARMYVELAKLGAGLEYLDVGGGLGVDYDGAKAGGESGINYSLEEYANNVVYHVGEVCRDAGVAEPTLVTESGRAMVAHHSVLVTDVLGWSSFDRFAPRKLDGAERAALPTPVRTLYETHESFDPARLCEYFHDAQVAREQTLSLFSLGHCSLAHRGLAERLFYAIGARVYREAQRLDPVSEEFASLETLLSDIYFCNASVFQSLPDSWAIGQLFPIMPLHRLGERPTRRGVLADITCDSDGKIDRFVTPEAGQDSAGASVLPLHPYTGGDYLLGVFLVGAYQETLGDLHNLFGDTNAVHVTLDDDGGYEIGEVVEGDTVSEVLRYVQFDPEALRRTYRKTLEAAVRRGKLTVEESALLRRFYEQGLAGSTYLD